MRGLRFKFVPSDLMYLCVRDICAFEYRVHARNTARAIHDERRHRLD